MNDMRERLARAEEIDGVLFIDANQYLNLCRMGTATKLLAPLKEQQDYIFVTRQIVDEVQRNKVAVAASVLEEALKTVGNVSVPGLRFATIGEGERKRVKEISSKIEAASKEIEAASKELKTLTHDLLGKISRSEDEVSKALAGIFTKATPHTDDELMRARARKERGNAPGKRDDPLGDQLNWEQILSRCKDKSRLWIITRDGDYVTKYDDKLVLNAALYRSLTEERQSTLEVRCYDNIPEGIKDFADTVHVKAQKLPNREETEQIKKEQEALSRLDWMTWGTETTRRRDTRLTPGQGILGLNYHV